MTKTCTVLYNGACPICAREVAVYRAEARVEAPHLVFADVTDPELGAVLAAQGLTDEAAARRFHIVRDGVLLSGVDAFLALWSDLPRWRGVARVVGSRPILPVARFLYDRAAAPVLYTLHRRRQRKRRAANRNW